MTLDSQILSVLSQIMDPDLGKDIVSLGFVKNLEILENGEVAFQIELTTPACPVKDLFRKQAEELVLGLSWVKKVTVTMGAKKPHFAENRGALSQVGAIVVVSSCKGGVGKSTVAVNLALALSQAGARVGIFDADIYGPSLPTMMRPERTAPLMEGSQILPIEAYGLKMMSFGFVQGKNGESGAAVMRGPMVSQVIGQLLNGTRWGELDYLIIDMPPGTGDIQITLGQIIPITAAVIVTTPQTLSYVDVVKGVQMFDKLKVPTISVVENMSFFICDSCEKVHHIFGKGAVDRLVLEYGFSNRFEIPVEKSISPAGDSGVPYLVSTTDGPVVTVFRELAASVAREVSKLKFGQQNQAIIHLKNGQLFIEKDGQTLQLDNQAVRLACKCAHCIDDLTGESKVRPEKVPQNLTAITATKVGNYATGVDWSDHHRSLYPIELLCTLGQKQSVGAK